MAIILWRSDDTGLATGGANFLCYDRALKLWRSLHLIRAPDASVIAHKRLFQFRLKIRHAAAGFATESGAREKYKE